MISTGLPGDEDPQAAEDPECDKCGGLLEVGKGWCSCPDCGAYSEVDPPEPKDYEI